MVMRYIWLLIGEIERFISISRILQDSFDRNKFCVYIYIRDEN